jgi:hypothetical protein
MAFYTKIYKRFSCFQNSDQKSCMQFFQPPNLLQPWMPTRAVSCNIPSLCDHRSVGSCPCDQVRPWRAATDKFLSGLLTNFCERTRRRIPADGNFPPPHTVCVCVDKCHSVDISNSQSPAPLSTTLCRPPHTHHQHGICMLCIQQISKCDAHLFVSLFVITFQHNNRQETVPYWLMSSTCHTHHRIHLRAIIWHLFVVAFTSRLGEKTIHITFFATLIQ